MGGEQVGQQGHRDAGLEQCQHRPPVPADGTETEVLHILWRRTPPTATC